uniref:Zinc transporter ZIP4/12 EF-hand domain-containing protein n=1 Tax=Oncorhynchus tshawytscha TaxID=74940 RepID=A0A8C8C555_ONCTS
METIYRYFPVILLCLSLNLFSYAWGSPVDVYGKVVELVSPGEEYLDEMSVRSFFKLLEKRVQCPGVSCEKQCLTGQDIMEEMNEGVPHNMDVMFGYIVYHALQGDCMTARALPEEDYFLDFIFNSFGSDNITIHELEGLMKSLQLEGHNDDHGHDDHVDHDHSDHSDAFRTSHEEGYHQRNISSWELTCFSPEELIKIHGLNGSSLSRSDVARLSPALVQQLLSGACNSISPPTGPLDQLSTTEKFVYASIANLLICLAALVGVMVLLCTSCSSVFQLVIQFCVSLAVGSLTGDALLHLLPMFLGLHVHSEGTDHSHSEEVPDYICKILVMMAGIYCFYLMETIFSIITTHKDSHHHSLHHHGEESEPHHCDHGKVLEMYLQEKNNKQSISQTDLVGSHSEDTEKAFPEQNQLSREQRLLPYMVTIGDGIHNFADGLAIGAAFSVSWNSGLATSLAVFCHELPHELGDFAILLHSGLSVKKALMLNVGSALTSFIGLYIALTVSTDLATKQWIAAITSGLFLYVGLADMLPTMIHADNRRPWLMFLLQNLGLLSGWGILLLLSLYEEKIGF